MSYQPLFLGLGTAVISTSASTSYLEGETANLRFGQALVFQDNTFGGVPTNSVVYVKEVIDANNFTISAALDGIVLELDDGTGFMIAKSVQRENVGESLKKVDDMLDEIFNVGLGGDGVGITSIQEDASPTLGGNLNVNGNTITGSGAIALTGNINATTFTGEFRGVLAGSLIGPVDEQGIRTGNPTIDGLAFELGTPVGGQVIAWDAPAQKFTLTSVTAIGGLDTLDDVLFRGNTSNRTIDVSGVTTDTLTVTNGLDYADINNPPTIPSDISELSDNLGLLGQGGGSMGYRTSASATTGPLFVNGVGNLSITGFTTYALLALAVEIPAWVRVYTSSAARTADAARLETEDPLLGSGVIAEVITTQENEIIYFTPATIGFNNETPLVPTIYLSVKNKGGGLATIQVTLTLLQLEA